MHGPTVAKLFASRRFHHANERELQDGIESVLREAGYSFDRERQLAPGDVIDFLVAGGLGIEVKVAGGMAEVTRQLHRYAQHADVTELLLVSTRLRHGQLPDVLNGKPLRFQPLLGGLL